MTRIRLPNHETATEARNFFFFDIFLSNLLWTVEIAMSDSRNSWGKRGREQADAPDWRDDHERNLRPRRLPQYPQQETKLRSERLKYPYVLFEDRTGGQDDGKYEGEFQGYQRHGKGKMVYKNGDVYDGYWKDGLLHGHGTYTKSGGNETYSGNYVNGVLQGKVTCYSKSGAYEQIYEGEFRDGLFEGKGVEKTMYDDSLLARYEGRWERDLKHGKGQMHYEDGSLFVGRWERGEISGFGKYHTISNADDDVCFRSGTFKPGEDEYDPPEQQDGLVQWGNGDEYEGQLHEGQPHGKGVYRYQCGDVCRGDFHDGRSEGQVAYTYANGCHFDGRFVQDQEDGKGACRWADGLAFEGLFESGRPMRGVETTPNGRRFDVVYDGLTCLPKVPVAVTRVPLGAARASVVAEARAGSAAEAQGFTGDSDNGEPAASGAGAARSARQVKADGSREAAAAGRASGRESLAADGGGATAAGAAAPGGRGGREAGTPSVGDIQDWSEADVGSFLRSIFVNYDPSPVIDNGVDGAPLFRKVTMCGRRCSVVQSHIAGAAFRLYSRTVRWRAAHAVADSMPV